MKKSIRFLLLLAALGTALTGLAQPTVKLLVIDMSKALNDHYKTAEINAKFQAEAQKVDEQLGEMSKQIQATGDQAKELIEQSKNTMLKDEVRKQYEADAQKKIQEYQQMQSDAQDYKMKNQQSFQQRAQNHRDLLFEEITNVARDIARSRGATLVLDKSGPPIRGIPVVIYSDASYDITEDVVKEINKNRPPPPPPSAATTAPKPADQAAPAPAAPPEPEPKKP